MWQKWKKWDIIGVNTTLRLPNRCIPFGCKVLTFSYELIKYLSNLIEIVVFKFGYSLVICSTQFCQNNLYITFINRTAVPMPCVWQITEVKTIVFNDNLTYNIYAILVKSYSRFAQNCQLFDFFRDILSHFGLSRKKKHPMPFQSYHAQATPQDSALAAVRPSLSRRLQTWEEHYILCIIDDIFRLSEIWVSGTSRRRVLY